MTTNNPDDDLLRELGAHTRERHTREALRPLSKDFEQRMQEQIKQATDDTARNNPPRSPRQRVWFALAASVIVAVGLSFGLVNRSPINALPDYALEFRDGATVRSTSDSAALRSGDQLDVVLRPQSAIAEPLTMLVVRQDGDALTPVDVTTRWSESGAARVRITLNEQLNLDAGRQVWWFVVARADQAPALPALATLDGDTRRPDWQAFRHQFEWHP